MDDNQPNYRQTASPRPHPSPRKLPARAHLAPRRFPGGSQAANAPPRPREEENTKPRKSKRKKKLELEDRTWTSQTQRRLNWGFAIAIAIAIALAHNGFRLRNHEASRDLNFVAAAAPEPRFLRGLHLGCEVRAIDRREGGGRGSEQASGRLVGLWPAGICCEDKSISYENFLSAEVRTTHIFGIVIVRCLYWRTT